MLTSVPGVSEVASVGGYEKQYQVEVDPVRLQAFGIPITRVMDAVQGSNAETGARVLEVAGREYMIRALGYARGIGDLENAVVGDDGVGHAGPGARRRATCSSAPTSAAARPT